MSLTFTIGGRSYLSELQLSTLQISHGAESQGASCEFVVSLLTAGSLPPPAGNQGVTVTFNNAILFSGIILEVAVSPPSNANYTDYRCQCTTYVHWLSSKLISTERPEELAGHRIKALLGYIRGHMSDFQFTTHGVEDGFRVEAATYDYVDFVSILSELAEACQFQWRVDFDLDIQFYSQRSAPSPLPNNTLDMDSILSVGDFTITEDTSQIKNRVYIKGFSQRGENDFVDGPFTPEPNESFFKLYQPPFDVENSTVRVQGEPRDRNLKLDPLDGARENVIGAPGEAYLCLFNMGVRFPLIDLPTSPFTVTYKPEMPDQVAMFEDPLSIRYFRRMEGSSGVHEFMASAAGLKVTNIDPIAAMGEFILRRSAWPIISVSFSTYEVHGWHPGQFFFLKSALRNIYDYRHFEATGQRTNLAIFVRSISQQIFATKEGYLLRETIDGCNIPYL